MTDFEYYSKINALLQLIQKPLIKKGKKPEVTQALNEFNQLSLETRKRLADA